MDLPAVEEHVAGLGPESEHGVVARRLLNEALGEEVVDDQAPVALVAVLADPEGLDAVMAKLADAVGRIAGDNRDDVVDPEALARSGDGGHHDLGVGGGVETLHVPGTDIAAGGVWKRRNRR